MNKNRITFMNPLLGGAWALATTLAMGVALTAAKPALAAVVVSVSTNDALPGGTLTLQMRVDRAVGDSAIAGVQADVILSTEQLNLVGTCSSDQSACENGSSCPNQGRCVPTCEADARLTQHSLAAAFPDFQNVPTGRRRLRLPINPNSFPPPTLTDGLLVTCTFGVLPGAALGPVGLTADSARFQVSDDASDPVVATLELHAGSIVSVLSTVSPTPTQTPVPPTVTATVATPTENVPTVTPTAGGATVTPTVAQPTNTPLSEATVTPTVTNAVVTATFTVAVSTTTPTRTAPIPTSTPIQPTATASVAATLTPTTIPATATSVRPSVTPTAGNGGRGDDGDGCVMTPRSERQGSGAGFLLLPIAGLLLRRRRSSRK